MVGDGDGEPTITEPSGTLRLKAIVEPENASNKSVTWSVNNESIATIDQNGLLTALANGTVKVTATAKDGSGVAGSLDVTISGQEEPIEEPAEDLAIETATAELVDGNLVLTVTAEAREELYSLEVDHSLEEILPEFTVYADAAKPWGDLQEGMNPENFGVSLVYDNYTWTLTFAPGEGNALDVINANGGIDFYLIVHDEAKELSSGSMGDEGVPFTALVVSYNIGG